MVERYSTIREVSMRRVIRKCIRLFIFASSLPISLILILLFPLYKIKWFYLRSDRIGHYAMNTELLLCYLDRIQTQQKKTTVIFYLSEAPICNNQLHLMWKRIIFIFPFAALADYIDRTMALILGKYYKNKGILELGCADRHESLKQYPSHLSFTQDEKIQGEVLLQKLGVSKQFKWVCILARDSAYLDQYLSGMNWAYHNLRDCDIDNFKKTALFLANNGYYVIRMGKSVKKPFFVDHPNVIDYANHSLRSDFLDIYLSAHCEFFISTATGLDSVPKIFRRPVLLVNIAPIKGQLEYFYPNELFIFKKFYDQNQQRYLSLQEVDFELNSYRDVQYEATKRNWVIVENTEDEILEVTQEMCKKMNMKENINKANAIQAMLSKPYLFSGIMDRELLKDHPEKFYVKIGEHFMENNTFLFHGIKDECEFA